MRLIAYVMLLAIGILWSEVRYQNSVISQQQTLVRKMMQNPACLVEH